MNRNSISYQAKFNLFGKNKKVTFCLLKMDNSQSEPKSHKSSDPVDIPKKKKSNVTSGNQKSVRKRYIDSDDLSELKEVNESLSTCIENLAKIQKSKTYKTPDPPDPPVPKTPPKHPIIYIETTKATEFSAISMNQRENRIKELIHREIPLKQKILELPVPIETMAEIMKKYYEMERLDQTSMEYCKRRTWIETIIDIPWNKIKKFPVSYDDGNELINEHLKLIRKNLDRDVYGLEPVKEKIIEFVNNTISDPKGVIGHVLALKGSPGVGKTRLIRCLGDALDLPFFSIPMGGANDVNYFKGFGLTYETSEPGIIIKGFIRAGCLNLIIYLDEIDKISKSDKAYDAIFGFLTHLLDPEQNMEYYDEYLGNIPVDASKVLFVLSYNDPNKVDSIVGNRIEVIDIPDPDIKQKVEIAKRHIIPEILERRRFTQEDVIFTDTIIKHIIMRSKVQDKGLRQLRRNIHAIISRLRVLKNTAVNPDLQLELSYRPKSPIEFPVTLNKDHIDLLFDEHVEDNMSEAAQRMFL